MSDLERGRVIDALAAGYGKLTEAVEVLGDAELMIASRCAGWTVGDVLYHQLLDARRALRTFVTPGTSPVDVDDISYWRPFSPGSGHAFALGGAEAAAHARHVRIVASAYPPGDLVWEWRETSSAACRAARACPHETVSTQGHTLRTADFVATLAVESAIHFLDLTVGLPAPPAPDPASLALVRRVLDGLLALQPPDRQPPDRQPPGLEAPGLEAPGLEAPGLEAPGLEAPGLEAPGLEALGLEALSGAGLPVGWDDRTYALKGTGRLALTDSERAALGPLAGRFPLFG